MHKEKEIWLASWPLLLLNRVLAKKQPVATITHDIVRTGKQQQYDNQNRRSKATHIHSLSSEAMRIPLLGSTDYICRPP